MTDTLELRNRNLTCVIAPEFGASVLRLDVVKKGATYNVLAPTPADILKPGCDQRHFSLAHIAPWGGPIRNNRFKWEGKFKDLEPNLPDAPLFTHGIVWQRPWEGKKDGKHSATFKYVHKKQPGWVFDFSIIAIFDLEEDHLAVTYELANEGKMGIMPVGFGSTMRLPKLRKTLLSAGVSTLWHEDATGVPTTPGEVPFSLDLKEGVQLDAVNTPDRWFSGWTGKASLDYAESKMSLMVKAETPICHLGFACNKADDFMRLTPLTHVPGALDILGCDEDETGYAVLGPGESTTAKIRIDVDLGLY